MHEPAKGAHDSIANPSLPILINLGNRPLAHTTIEVERNSEMRGFPPLSELCTLVDGRMTEGPLRRLFSSYPDGMLGVGLLLFRLIIGVMTIVFAIRWIAGAGDRSPYVWVIGVVTAACGAMLVLGLMTLIAGVTASASILAITLSAAALSSLLESGSAVLNLVTAILALGLALTGPGAFSLEGRLYGRREIVVPPRDSNN